MALRFKTQDAFEQWFAAIHPEYAAQETVKTPLGSCKECEESHLTEFLQIVGISLLVNLIAIVYIAIVLWI